MPTKKVSSKSKRIKVYNPMTGGYFKARASTKKIKQSKQVLKRWALSSVLGL